MNVKIRKKKKKENVIYVERYMPDELALFIAIILFISIAPGCRLLTKLVFIYSIRRGATHLEYV
jgi:hypothetical protein